MVVHVILRFLVAHIFVEYESVARDEYIRHACDCRDRLVPHARRLRYLNICLPVVGAQVSRSGKERNALGVFRCEQADRDGEHGTWIYAVSVAVTDGKLAMNKSMRDNLLRRAHDFVGCTCGNTGRPDRFTEKHTKQTILTRLVRAATMLSHSGHVVSCLDSIQEAVESVDGPLGPRFQVQHTPVTRSVTRSDDEVSISSSVYIK